MPDRAVIICAADLGEYGHCELPVDHDGMHAGAPPEAEQKLHDLMGRVAAAAVEATAGHVYAAGYEQAAADGVDHRSDLGEAVVLIGELVDWFGAPDWAGPQAPVDLCRRIARFMDRVDPAFDGVVAGPPEDDLRFQLEVETGMSARWFGAFAEAKDRATALEAVLRHALVHWAVTPPFDKSAGDVLAEWDDTDWADSGWAPAEQEVIRSTLAGVAAEPKEHGDG